MGCASSRAEDSRLVSLCVERRELIRAAAEQRFALAAAHAAYFRQLTAVGSALTRFTTAEISPGSSSSTRPSSPVVRLPAESKGKGSGAKGVGSASPRSPSPSDLSLEKDASELKAEGKKAAVSPSSSPIYHFYRSSSTIPSKVYEKGYDYSYGFQYEDPIGFAGNMFSSSGEHKASSEPKQQTPPPPPLAHRSPWEFLDPFNSYEEFTSELYGAKSKSILSWNSQEMREREGVPDLEDEREVKTAKAAERIAKPGVREEEASSEKKSAATLDDEKSLSDEESRSTRAISQSSESTDTEIPVNDPRDLTAVAKDINNQFELALKYSDEVSGSLEVGKIRHHARAQALSAISSRVLGPLYLPVTASSCVPLTDRRRTRSDMLKVGPHRTSSSDARSQSLSSTLDKLSVWERKLLVEVKEEEKLRIIYMRTHERLTELDRRGAEAIHIERARSLLKRIRSKLSIKTKTIQIISNKIHKIRDTELQPQLIELVLRMIRMWSHVLECHEKQLKAMKDTSNRMRARAQDRSGSVAKATAELEQEVLRWCACFDKWSSTQKFFITALNEWLLKWLPQERQETPDGPAPFSPGRLGAPPVFIVSNDWSQAAHNVSGSKVSKSVRDFAAALHDFRTMQLQEHQHRQMAEVRSKKATYVMIKDGSPDGSGRAVQLEELQVRGDEEHMELVRQLHEASSMMPTRLLHVFQELVDFVSENLYAYNEIRTNTYY